VRFSLDDGKDFGHRDRYPAGDPLWALVTMADETQQDPFASSDHKVQRALSEKDRWEPEKDISLIEVLTTLAITLGNGKRLLLGLPVLAMVLAAVYVLLAPFSYTASTTFLQPQQQQSAAAAALQQLGGQLGGLANVAGAAVGLRRPEDLYFAMLRSERLQNALIDRFGLMERYKTQYRQIARYELEGNVSISVERGGLLKIEATDRDPVFVARLANAHVEELRKLLGQLAVTEAQQRRAFMEQQLLIAKEGLVKAEVALKQTQERTGLIALDRQGEAIIRASADLRAQIVSREVQLQGMRTFATLQNADVQRIASEIVGLKAELSKLEEGQIRGRGGVIVPTGKVPEAGLDYIRAAREVKYHEIMFELFARQFELAKADEARDAPLVQQVDVAYPPEFRSKPKRKQIVLITGGTALLISAVLVLVLAAIRKARSDPERSRQIEMFRRAWRLRSRS